MWRNDGALIPVTLVLFAAGLLTTAAGQGNRQQSRPPAEPLWGEYVRADDGAFRWEARSSTDKATGLITITGKVVSQTWHGTTWDHDITLVSPKRPLASDVAVVFLPGFFPAKACRRRLRPPV